MIDCAGSLESIGIELCHPAVDLQLHLLADEFREVLPRTGYLDAKEVAVQVARTSESLHRLVALVE